MPRSVRDVNRAMLVRRWVERRGVVLGAASGLFVLVFMLRGLSTDPGDGLALLFVVPIALVALELGMLGGLFGAGLAMLLLGAWALRADVDLDAVGLLTRGTAFVTVGAVAGRFSGRMRQVQRRQQKLLESGLELAHLTTPEQVATTLARGAQELLGRGVRVEIAGLATVTTGSPGPTSCQRFPIALREALYGTLAVEGTQPLDAEDTAAASLLALQAAIASKNQQLLADERERARIRVELQDARSRLEERGQQLRELIASQEVERHQVANELHEEAAQMLAAVLLGLGSLERELGSEMAAPQIAGVRSAIDDTLRSLRSLAGTLRPSVLDLGLEAALHRLADRSDGRARVDSMIVVIDHPASIAPATQTMAYRIIEEAVKAVGDATHVEVRDGAADELVIRIRRAGGLDMTRLALLGARLTPVGGTLTTAGRELHILIPLKAEGPKGE